MAETVTPSGDAALFYRGDVMYHRLAVDTVRGADVDYDVYFLATGWFDKYLYYLPKLKGYLKGSRER